MNDKQQKRFPPPSIEYRSRDVQQFLDNLDLLRKDPKTDDTSEIAAFLSNLENQPEEESRRARELIEKVAREQEIRTKQESLRAQELIEKVAREQEIRAQQEGLPSFVGPPIQTALDRWDEDYRLELGKHFPWDVKNEYLIDPPLARMRYLEQPGDLQVRGLGGEHLSLESPLPHIRWINAPGGISYPYVLKPGAPTVYEKKDQEQGALHEMYHALYDQGIGGLHGLRAAERGLKKARLGSEENYIRLREILSSQNNADLLTNLDTFAWYMNFEGYKDWRSPREIGRSRLQRKDDFEEIFTKISQAKKEDDIEALAELVPELLGKFNLPLSVDEWDKRDYNVRVSPLVASYLKPPARYEPYKPTWLEKLIKNPQRVSDTVEMPEDFRAGGRVRLI